MSRPTHILTCVLYFHLVGNYFHLLLPPVPEHTTCFPHLLAFHPNGFSNESFKLLFPNQRPRSFRTTAQLRLVGTSGSIWPSQAPTGPPKAGCSASIQLQRSPRRRPHSISSRCASTLPLAQHSSAARQRQHLCCTVCLL